MVKTTSFERACMPAWHSPMPFKSLHLPKYMQMFFCKRISHLEIDFYSSFFPSLFFHFWFQIYYFIHYLQSLVEDMRVTEGGEKGQKQKNLIILFKSWKI